MKKPPIPPDEQTRLEALDALNIVYSPAEQRFDRITSLARCVFDVPISLVSLVTEKCQWFKSAQGLAADQTPREISFCGHAILSDDIFVVPDALEDPRFADNPLVTDAPHIRFYAGQPLHYEGSRIGTLCIIDRRPRQLSTDELATLKGLGAWAENELKVTALSEVQTQLLAQLDESRRQALIDPLTKVWNRRGMDELINNEIEQAAREETTFSILLIDVDAFKDINDKHGHAAGDLALKEVAQRIRASVRPQDVIARYGGDEFAVFVRDCDADMAQVVGARILERVRCETIECAERRLRINISIGASVVNASPTVDINKVIECSDAALYDAKAAGRNCMKLRKHE